MRLTYFTKRILALGISSTALLATTGSHAQPATNAPAGPFPDQRDNVSYAIGVNIGMTIKRNAFDVNLDLVNAAIRDAMAGSVLKLTEEQVNEALRVYQQEVSNLRNKARIAENKAWLEQNKKKEGVKTREVTLPDGTKAELQYKVVKEGEGSAPAVTDTVAVNYRGTLINGQEFDSSIRHGKPGRFVVNQVIPGWTEALKMMKPGSKYELGIPSELGYGQAGSPPAIYPGATLIFEVELVSVNPPPEEALPAITARPAATSDIIRVPSAEELAKGAKIEVIKAEEADRMAKEAAAKAATNNTTGKK